jgi:xylulokinase
VLTRIAIARLAGSERMNVLGIDVGTSALKAVLVDEHQAILAEASVPLRASSPRPGWSEQDSEDWCKALREALARLRAARPDALARVRGLGLSGQMHGAVLVDTAGAVIRPAILWNDGRATRESEELAAAIPDLPLIAGVIAMPGFTAPKLAWLRRHEPASFQRIWKVLSAKDFLRLRLTGEAVSEMSDAAGTLWLDQAERDWSEPILAATGLSRAAMPDLVEGPDPAGEVRPEFLRDWGIDAPVMVAGGAGDAAAAGIGIGAVADGDAFVSLGTSGQFFVTGDRYRPSPETLLHAFAHALPGRWFRMAAMLNGASCLDWVARLVGEPDLALLLANVEAAYRGPSPAIFLPYLSGERTPHNDPNARGVFFGLDPATQPLDLVQVAMEGVVFSFMEAQVCLEAAGIRLESVAAVGGGARSRFWMQLLAHGLGKPVVRYSGSEKGPAFGAARLARLALTRERPEAWCAKPPVLDVLEPDPALHAAYHERFERFRRLYRALKGEFAS